MRVVVSARAALDLEEIGDFIAGDSLARAAAFIDALSQRCESPARHPFKGRLAPEIGPGARINVLGRHLVPYQVVGDTISIERVVHGARDRTGLLDDPSES
ncbi:MAG: type II toxin-antitoxin system RelE/ParE family toxin [Methylobacterium frigidaeris]